MASDKTYTEKVNLYFIRTKYGNYPQFDKKWAKGQYLIKHCFLKRINFELIRNIMHQVKSLRDSFIPPQRTIETFQYPRYVIRLQKERRIQAKRKNLHEKICTKIFARKYLHENDVPAN